MHFLGRFRGQGARLICAQSSEAQGWEVTKPCAAGRMNSWRDSKEASLSGSSLASARYSTCMHRLPRRGSQPQWALCHP